MIKSPINGEQYFSAFNWCLAQSRCSVSISGIKDK